MAARLLPKRWRVHFLNSTGYALRKMNQGTNHRKFNEVWGEAAIRDD